MQVCHSIRLTAGEAEGSTRGELEAVSRVAYPRKNRGQMRYLPDFEDKKDCSHEEHALAISGRKMETKHAAKPQARET